VVASGRAVLCLGGLSRARCSLSHDVSKSWVLGVDSCPGLLWAFLRHCVGNGRVSFEGDLQQLGILSMQGASYDETELLERQTTWPRQDFVILPIQPRRSRR
jgi:hypothetical protein